MKRLISVISAVMFCSVILFAQMGKMYVASEQAPKYKGGTAALKIFIEENLRYPEKALKQNITGIVVVQVITSREGKVKKARIIQSDNDVLNKEALRLAKSLPDFLPGTDKGVAIEGLFTFPIEFKIKSTQPDNTDSAESASEMQNSTPVFPGGNVALQQFISDNLKYPQDAYEKKIQGVVEVRFKILKDGSISNIQLVKGVHPSLDSEALRLASIFPNFTPAYIEGEPVDCIFNLPVTFKIYQPKSNLTPTLTPLK